MKKIFKFLKYLLIALISLIFLLLIGIAIFAYFFDLNKYKEQISQIVEKQIGREFAIDGNAKLGISLIPTLELEKVRLANAKWSKNPNMVELERLDVKVSILPLLRKEIEIYKLILIKPMIYLEINKDGKANWEFEALKSAALGYKVYAQNAQTVVNDVIVQNNSEEFKMPIDGLFAKNILIRDGFVEFSNHKNNQDIKLKINEFNITSESIDSDMNFKFDVAYNDETIKGTATVGSLRSLVQDYNPYPFNLDITAFGANAKVGGSVIDALSKDLHYVLNVDATNPRGNFGAPQVKFVGVVDGNVNSVGINIHSLDVEENIITGNVVANIKGTLPYVFVSLNSDRFDLRKLKTQTASLIEFPSLISSAHAAERLIKDAPLPFDVLKTVNADAKASMGTIIISDDMQIDKLNLTAKLKDGLLNADPITILAGDGTLAANASVNANNSSVKFSAKSQDIKIQKLYTALQSHDNKNFAILDGGSTDLNINITGSGKTVKSLISSLDGQVIAIVNKSKINSGELRFIKGNFFSQIMGMLNIRDNAEVNSTLNCAVVRADISKGSVNFPNGIAFDTNGLKLSSDGSINLNNEKIDFSIKPFSGSVTDVNISQIISSFIRVTGTLSEPGVGLDKTQTAKTAVGLALNAPVYAASAVLLDASSAPCYTALEKTSYSSRFPKPTGVAATGQDAYKGVEDAVKNTIKSVTSGNTEDLKNTAKDVLKMFKK
ncbi:MAG: AsmA family protein [Lactobacillaceae bacterium]|jgi:uncharacterized protein involved in outer membrane biogenesis|nr:AsmA family protein [Lactobacillaceae bacterium]